MLKLKNDRFDNPDSYNIWDAGSRNIVQQITTLLERRKILPLLPYSTIDVTRSDKRWYQHVNYHSMALELILSGSMEYRTERETRIAGPGMLYVVARGSNVRMAKTGDRLRRKLVLLITGSCVDSIADSLGFGTDQLIRLSHPEKVELMMREIEQGIVRQENQEMLSAKVYSLLLYLASELPPCPDDLRPALEIINNTPSHRSRLLIARLARSCRISESTLRRRFAEFTGVSPKQYLQRKRLILSRDLLTGGMSVKEISAICGFSSPTRFSRQFRDFYGMTPVQFRKQSRAAGSEHDP